MMVTDVWFILNFLTEKAKIFSNTPAAFEGGSRGPLGHMRTVFNSMPHDLRPR